MALPTGKCPRCGVELQTIEMHNEQFLVCLETGDIKGAQRTFLGNCPEHGPVFAAYKMGNHSTLAEAQLKRRYDKEARRRILAQLTPGEQRAFAKSVEGKRGAGPDEVKRWDDLAAAP